MKDREKMARIRKLASPNPSNSISERLEKITDLVGEKKKRKKTEEGTHDRQGGSGSRNRGGQ